jgi:hypothetical protein
MVASATPFTFLLASECRPVFTDAAEEREIRIDAEIDAGELARVLDLATWESDSP